MVFSRKQKRIAAFSDMIGGKPTLSAEFKFAGPHTLDAFTWKEAGNLEDKVPVSVNLEEAFARLPPASD